MIILGLGVTAFGGGPTQGKLASTLPAWTTAISCTETFVGSVASTFPVPTQALAGNGFDPTQISGLQYWLRADMLVTSSSNKISQWGDNSSNAFNFIQNTGSNQPTTSSGTGPKNTQPSVHYAGSQWLANTSVSISPTSATFVVVHKPAGITTGQYILNGSGNSGGCSLTLASSASSKRNVTLTGVSFEADTTSNATTNWECWLATYGSAPLQALRVNGSAHTISPNNSAPAASSAGNTVGAFHTGTVSYSGDVWEVIAYNKVLNSTEITNLESYISSTTGIF